MPGIVPITAPAAATEAEETEYVFPVRRQEKRILPPPAEAEYVFSLRRCRCRCCGDDGGGGGVGHKNACLNKNVTLAPLPQRKRLFCLREPQARGDREAV